MILIPSNLHSFVPKRYDELYAPVSGPANPFKTQQQAAHKNTLAGFVEDAHVNEFQFETQRRTFHRYLDTVYGWNRT